MSVELTTLGEYARIQGGYAYKSKDFSGEGSYPVLKIKNVRFGHVDYSEASYVSEDIANETREWKTKEGDILISMTGSGPNAPQSLVGRVARVWADEPEAWINQRVGKIVLKNEGSIHPDFLFYLLSSSASQDYLVSNSSGSANQANISGKIIESLPCPKIGYEESAQIAKILRELDQKILINRQTNQTLEAMAQALFKSWFVDFDPVFDNIIAHNLAHNNAPLHNIPEPLLPHAQRRLNVQNVGRGSARQTAAHAFHHLFPQAFEQSDEPSVGIQGWVPKGWGAVAMESLVDIASSKRVFAKDYKEKGVPFFRGKEISELSKGNKINTEIFISEEKFEELKNLSGIPKEGDILITSVGTIGNTYQVTRDDRFYFKDGNLTWIKAYKKVFMPHFIMEWFRNSAGIEAIERIKIGTTQQAITIKGLNKILIVNAPKNILLEFEAICSSLYRKIGKNIKETSSLESLRDTLLPKLISGELRIPDAEQSVAALVK